MEVKTLKMASASLIILWIIDYLWNIEINKQKMTPVYGSDDWIAERKQRRFMVLVIEPLKENNVGLWLHGIEPPKKQMFRKFPVRCYIGEK